MGFDLSGFVLRPPRTATGNALTTDEANNGVAVDFKPLPVTYFFTGSEAPELVDVASEQYRAATLLRTFDGQTEYLLWAANTSNVWVREGLAKEINNPESVRAAGSRASVVLGGTESVYDDNDGEPVLREDGSLRFSVREPSGQSVASVVTVRIRRGDLDDDVLFGVNDLDFNDVSGVVTLTNTTLIGEAEAGIGSLAGGISKLRGDTIREIRVTIAASRFWWSKNDRYETRFQWDGGSERWQPLKGTAPRNLGRLLPDTEYILSPNPNIAIGEFLPGNSADSDDYTMVRLGVRPDASSTPVAEPVAASGFGGIKVVTDDEVEAEEGFDFANLASDAAGVMGSTTGKIVWNPGFLEAFAGQEIWYSYRSFLTDNPVEPLGSLEGTDVEPLFLAPIPASTDYPFIRIGNRNPLEAILVDTDALLFVRTIEEGQVGISLSTGRMKFSDTDIAKADPESPTFNPAFLGSVVFYDGLALTQVPLSMRDAVALVDSGGVPKDVSSDKDQALYVPDAVPLPTPGISGVQHIPDATGGIPDPAIEPGIRANGSNLRREVRGDWDLVLFSDDGRVFRTVNVVDDPDDEIPRFPFQIDKGRAYLDLNKGAGGSKITLGKEDRKRFTGQKLWFRQTAVQPAVYAKQARMFSRVRDNFDLVGNEVFKFQINETVYVWRASSDPGGIPTSDGGTFTAAQMVTSLAAVAGSTKVVLRSGRIVIQSPNIVNGLHHGTVEIGFGEDDEVDLSGCAALGFLPAWRVKVTFPGEDDDTHWMPDNGSHIGVRRSPLNLDGTKGLTDIRHRGSVDDIALTERIPVNPVVLLDKVPIEDEPGYDDGVFFRLEAGLSQTNLEHYDEILHQFGEGKFTWISRDTTFSIIEQPVMDLALDQQQAVPDSFRLPANGLSVSETGGALVEQTLNVDFILPFDGTPGVAKLIDTIGKRVAIGARGFFSSGSTTFTDDSPDVDFVALGVTKGYQVKITTGEAVGTYIVTADPTDPKELEVSPPFAVTDSTVSWELFFGVDEDTIDPAIVASEIFTEFNHLQEEPFKIRVMSLLGDLPATAADQDESRFVAVLGAALANGRPFSLRFGRPNASPTATLVQLQQSFLGVIANSALNVPAPDSERFANDAFSIKIGTKTYTFSNGDLIKVPGVLTFPLAGDVIEVQEGSGLLNFGAEVFAQFPQSEVYYVEEFNDPDSSPTELPEGTAEYRLSDGVLNFSAADMAQYAGMPTYLVEQMITEGGLDVALNPIQGSFLFTTPLRDQQIVETEYFQAEQGTGDLVLVVPEDAIAIQGQEPVGVPLKVIEFLPLFVRQEEATKPVIPPNSIVPASFSRTWEFNPTGRTLRDDIPPQVFVNNNLCNAGGSASPICTFDFENNRILFEEAQPDDAVVLITYSVLESFGGEQSYTVSTPPVYRPPFFIEDETDKFVLEGDRTDDVIPGKLLRVGPSPFYITGSTFDGENTTIEFFPKTEQEAGSRAPGNDVLTLLSDRPIAKQHNATAADGFWRTLDIPYEPVNRGFPSITFLGNITALAVVGTLLEVGGYPFIVAGATLSDDGTKTVVDLTTPSPTGFAAEFDEARLSVRPVYPPNPTMFLGVGTILPEDEVEAILFGENDVSGNLLPGRTLRLTLDYALDFDTGAIEFLSPTQAPLRPGQTLYLRRTQVGILAPVISDGVVINPRFLARYVHAIAPSNDNGILGETLRASYTFAAPDSFFYRTVPLVDYMAEIAGEISSDIAAQLPSNGAQPAVVPAIDNAVQGDFGLRGNLEDLRDEDRAARVFIEFYNGAVLAFEQVLETISGDIIGDRDGKFKFFIGRGKDIPPPGYENAISGRLNVRNVFSELFFAFNHKLIHLTRDALVEPASAELDGDQIIGKYIDPDFLSDLASQQREVVQNDIDDLVLVKRGRKRLRLRPIFRLEAFGRYRRLGEPSRFSRLFPQRAQAFMLTDPGIGADLEIDPVDPGVYSFRKKVSRLSLKGGLQLPKRASTFRKTIADIGNPVLGTITGVSRITLRERLPRARIFAYSDTGFPELDDDLTAAGFDSFTASPRPAVIATVLPLHQFPIRDDGMPDIEQLIAQDGELPDLSTGDPDLFTPPFETIDKSEGQYPMIAFGRPTGQIIDVAVTDTLTVEFLTDSAKVFKKLYVKEVMLGCVVTFAKDDESRVEDGSEIIEVGEEPDEGEPLVLERGDTIFVTPPDVDLESDDPPNNEDTAVSASGLPGYRIGFDVRIDRGDGEVVDFTFPSFRDPSILGIKELFGQRPPKPLDHLEAEVSFRNSLTEPAPIPALVGAPLNDSGDYTLPYLVAGNTEIDRLGEVTKAFDGVIALDTPIPSAVYPDEILGVDGTILADLSGTDAPGALLTSQDATPVATNLGVYVEHSGIGDVESYDFLFIQRGQPGIVPHAQGILSVGAVESDGTTSIIEPARFVSPSSVGTTIRYTFNNAIAFVNQPPTAAPPGMVVSRVGTDTIFDCTSISPAFLIFNDGSPPPSPTGGLNDIIDAAAIGLAYPGSTNVIRIHLWTADDGVTPPTFLQTVTIDINAGAPVEITGNLGTVSPAGISASEIEFDQQVLTIDSPAFVSIGGAPGDIPEDPGAPGKSVPLWFTIDIDVSDAGAGSGTGYIDTDRLSFVEGYDLRSVRSRDEPDVDSTNVSGDLEVFTISGPGTTLITVNEAAEVNGGAAFTWKDRSNVFPFTGGEFDTTTGVGRIKVMAFEGFGNTPIPTASPIIFSAIPSSPQDENGVIASGIGWCEGALTDYDNRVVVDDADVDPGGAGSGAALRNIEPGDVLFITASSIPAVVGNTKAGTYLVKHAIAPDSGAGIEYGSYTLLNKTIPTTAATQALQFDFPTLVSLDDFAGKVVISNAELPDGTPAWRDPAEADTRIWFIPDTTDITTVVSVEYTFHDPATGEFNIDLATIEDADGNALLSFPASIVPGITISGFARVEIRFDRAGQGLPRNLVGYRNDPATPALPDAAFGFGEVTIGNPTSQDDAGVDTPLQPGLGPSVLTRAASLVNEATGPTDNPDMVGSEILAAEGTPIANTSFDPDPDAIVYESVPTVFIFGLNSTEWVKVHGNITGAGEVRCLYPSDTVEVVFRAQAGVFLEPSIPRPILDLASGGPKVVDSANSLVASQIGMRDGSSFGADVDPVKFAEKIRFEVRRIRRFHQAMENIGVLLTPLRYAYEIRRGTVDTFGPDLLPPQNEEWPYVVEASGGTQLGGFDDADVNINPGDMFRLLDDGTLIDEVEIAAVIDSDRLALKAPGIIAVSPAAAAGLAFEVYLRKPPVPHEQSNEQLLDLLTDEVLLERTADYPAQEGGLVPVEATPTDPRRIKDTDSSINFAGLGVQSGDIVLIDPAGEVEGPGGVPGTGQERGFRPFGDRSVPNRVIAQPGQEVPFIAGAPAELDDNRGWYRVTQADSTSVEVSGENTFAGLGAGPITFGSEAEYAVLPTISNSTAPFADPPGGPGVEGQNDLRPTGFAGEYGSPADSYQGNLFSIAPFSYRIIRPSPLFSDEAVDLICFMRERTLSFLEEFDVLLQGRKHGNYFVFQRDQHIADLGNPLIPDDGLGVMSNALIRGAAGETQISPFANTSDSLSVLDRRFWVNDFRLDGETPPFQAGVPTYSTLENNDGNPAASIGDGRPVLPDLITDVLNNNDQFRPLRLAWIDYRVNREDGKLPEIKRARDRLPKELRKQRRALRQSKALEDL